ncbi:hypothetical protein DXG01_009068 [Tephrocybe rancida]|nr:hypothetical protein DXG01_009068 [Tephrocybe rancida]
MVRLAASLLSSREAVQVQRNHLPACLTSFVIMTMPANRQEPRGLCRTPSVILGSPDDPASYCYTEPGSLVARPQRLPSGTNRASFERIGRRICRTFNASLDVEAISKILETVEGSGEVRILRGIILGGGGNDDTVSPSSNQMAYIASYVWYGVLYAKREDVHTMSSAIVDIIGIPAVMSGLKRDVKVNRGLCHAVTGALLCPADLDWADIGCVRLRPLSRE